MDHISWPDDHPLTQPRIPYLCQGYEHQFCQDHESLQEWPVILQWKLDEEMSVLETARHCQLWLYFGVLKSICNLTNTTFDVSNFLTQSHGLAFLCSSRLPTVKRDLHNYLNGLSADDREYYSGRLCYSLTNTMNAARTWICAALDQFEAPRSPGYTENDLFYVFWVSEMLIDFMREPYTVGSKTSKLMPFEPGDVASPIVPGSPQLADLFRTMRRCPTVLLRTKCSALNAFRLVAIPEKGSSEHTTCDGYNCNRFDVDPSKYTPKHHVDCKSTACTMTSFEGGSISPGDIVQAAHIPIVCSELRPDRQTTISLADETQVDAYVAISHVWAGGLGNFEHNSLYQCQLRELHTDVSEQHKPKKKSDKRPSKVYYWLDTLCIPASKGAAKSKAIDQMARIYAGASNVLVVDLDLRHIKAQSLSKHDLTLLIRCSPWMARSWTLQEGALAMSLHFKFADKIVSLDELQVNGSLLTDSLLRSGWATDVDRFGDGAAEVAALKPISKYIDLPPQHDVPKQLKFVLMWNELSLRSSTMVGDLAAIVAGFIGCSAAEVLQLAPRERMLALLRSQEMLPVSLLFAPTMPCAGWCPDFPRSDIFRGPLSTDGHLMWMDDGRFAISKLPAEVFQVLLNEKVALDDPIVVHNHTYEETYHIDFHTTASKRPRLTRNRILLLLHRIETAQNMGNGICLGVEDNDALGTDRYETQFLASFDYRITMLTSCTCSNGSSDDLTEPLQSSKSSLAYIVPDALNVCTEQPLPAVVALIVDMGIQDWPMLKWKRSGFYPFAAVSLRTAKVIELFSMLGYFHVFMAYALMVGTIVIPRIMLGSHLQALYFTLGMIGALHFRKTLLDFEREYLRAHLESTLHQEWSMSFDPNIGDKSDLATTVWSQRMHLTPILINLGILVPTGAVVMMAVLNWWSPQSSTHINLGTVVVYKLAAIFVACDAEEKPVLGPIQQICRCYCFEAIVRLCILGCSEWLTTGSSVNSTSKYSLAIPFQQVLQAPLMVALTAWCWAMASNVYGWESSIWTTTRRVLSTIMALVWTITTSFVIYEVGVQLLGSLKLWGSPSPTRHDTRALTRSGWRHANQFLVEGAANVVSQTTSALESLEKSDILQAMKRRVVKLKSERYRTVGQSDKFQADSML